MLKVGIAGYGVVGKRRRECVEKNANLKLVCVCDQKLKNHDIIADNVRCYNNYKDLLSENLDIIIVSLTNDLAAEVSKAGLNNGLHVFCEKPPGRNIEELKEVINIEEKNLNLNLCMDLTIDFIIQ